MRIEDWYRNNGIFGNGKDDIDTRKKSLTTGEYVFDVEEVEIGDVRLRFVDKKGNEVTVSLLPAHALHPNNPVQAQRASLLLSCMLCLFLMPLLGYKNAWGAG